MSTITLDSPEYVIPWVLARIPHMTESPNTRAIGVLDDSGVLMAGALYYNYSSQYKSIEMAFATDGPRWATKGNIRAFLGYPFTFCQRVTLIIPRKNRMARRFVKGMGFFEEGVARRAFGDDDAVVYSMLSYEVERWIPPQRVAA